MLVMWTKFASVARRPSTVSGRVKMLIVKEPDVLIAPPPPPILKALVNLNPYAAAGLFGQYKMMHKNLKND